MCAVLRWTSPELKAAAARLVMPGSIELSLKSVPRRPAYARTGAFETNVGAR